MDPVPTAPTRSFAWAAVAASAAVFAFLSGVVWHSTTPMAWERPIIKAFVDRPLPLRDYWIGMFEPITFALLAIAIACAAAGRGQKRLAVTGLVGCVAAVVAAELVLKPVIDRVRTHLTGVHHHIIHFSRPTFPSAHVTAAASLAAFAWIVLGRRTHFWPLLVALPLIVGHSVVSRQMHYPADVIGGLILGPTVVYCVVEADRVLARRSVDGSAREQASDPDAPPVASREELAGLSS